MIKPQEKYIPSYCAAFDKVAKERKYLGVIEGFDYAQTAEFVKNSISKNIPYIFAIDSDTDQVVGWCDAQPIISMIGYLGIGLAEDYRGKGLGKRLLTRLLAEAKEFGYDRINLEVRGSNVRALALYKSVGFQYLRTAERAFILDGMVDDVIEMKIDI